MFLFQSIVPNCKFCTSGCSVYTVYWESFENFCEFCGFVAIRESFIWGRGILWCGKREQSAKKFSH